MRIPDPMQAQIALLHAIRCQCNLTQWPPVGFPIPHRSTAESWRRALLGRFESALWHMRGYLSPRAGCQRFKDDDSLDSGSGLDNKQTVSASLRFCSASLLSFCIAFGQSCRKDLPCACASRSWLMPRSDLSDGAKLLVDLDELAPEQQATKL